MKNSGHGHVNPRPDGIKARCGGPGLCMECSLEANQKKLDGLLSPDKLTTFEKRKCEAAGKYRIHNWLYDDDGIPKDVSFMDGAEWARKEYEAVLREAVAALEYLPCEWSRINGEEGSAEHNPNCRRCSTINKIHKIGILE